MSGEEGFERLAADEAWAFLAARSFGRFAVVLVDEPHIYPVNYAAPGSHPDQGIIYIRSAPGEKLFAAVTERPVAFEVDELRDEGATSVVARGTARLVDDEAERERVDALQLRPWIAAHRPEIIAIDVIDVSARRFRFGTPPTWTATEPPD